MGDKATLNETLTFRLQPRRMNHRFHQIPLQSQGHHKVIPFGGQSATSVQALKKGLFYVTGKIKKSQVFSGV
jgi:hypothetical protein